MPIDWDQLIPPPSDADRDTMRAGLVARARFVQCDGWDDYQATWSTGEVVGVAALLGDDKILTEFNETPDSVYGRYAFDLFGHSGGHAEKAAGFPETREWFTRARTDLATRD